MVPTRNRCDLKNVEFHLLNTGHFALEDGGPAIAAPMRRFLANQKEAIWKD